MKSFFTFKISWIFYLIIVVLGFMLVLHQKEFKETDTFVSIIEAGNESVKRQLKSAVICLDIEDEKPLLAKSKFSSKVDYLYCFNKFNAEIKPDSIYHQWVYKDRIIALEELSLSSDSICAWSRLEILPDLAGKWHVDIMTKGGTQLESVDFRLY